jgi:hypothetical protein
MYFMTRAQEIRYKRQLKDPRIAELTEMLLYRKPPKTVRHPLFEHKILKDDINDDTKKKLIAQIRKLVAEFQRVIDKHGTGREWILADIPEKDVVFTKSLAHVVKKQKTANLYREVDPVKVVDKHGKPSLLVERENSLMKIMSGYINFVPSVYANDAAIKLLRARGLIDQKV